MDPKDASYVGFNGVACKAPGCHLCPGAVAFCIVALDLETEFTYGSLFGLHYHLGTHATGPSKREDEGS